VKRVGALAAVLIVAGALANAAAVAAGEIKPGESVPNDYFILNPDHRLLTYRLPANAHATVLVSLKTTKVSVAYLAKLLKGKSGVRHQIRADTAVPQRLLAALLDRTRSRRSIRNT